MSPWLIKLAIALGLFVILLGGGSVMALRAQKRAKQRAARMEGVMAPYRPARAEAATTGLGLQLRGVTFASRAGALLRYDPARRAIYTVPLPVVIAGALVLALALARVVVDFAGSFGWASAPLAWIWLCRSYHKWCEARFLATLFKQFPDALAMIVRAVRVGLPVVEAIRLVARESAEPTAREFAGLVAQTGIGVPLEDALKEMAERTRLPEYRFFATALSLQSQTGGGLTETLENLADTIRKRVAAQVRGHALAAEARMSSYVLGGLPIVTGILLTVMNPEYMSVLFTDPSGRNLLLFGAILLAIGAFSMRTLIRKSLS